jgi:uncharacterized protein (DUF2235 family)
VAKNIVLCSDGTGNATIKNRGTNVYKLYEAVELGIKPDQRPQVAFYDDGVGTGGLKPMRVLGGAFGYGFARNVRDLYTDLVRVYEPGDFIYLFGFSRGAYTVRALAGMIATCGILDGNALSERELRRSIGEAYRVYRLRFRPDRQQELASRRAKTFRETHTVFAPGDPVRIAFIGVWDTVGAVGLPDDSWPKRLLWILSGYRVPWFKHYRLGDLVDRACHVLAIDDERQTFHPVLWEEPVADGSRSDGRPRLEQVWFAGVHSNVGGGYVKQGMSLVSLDWMMRRAHEAGLSFTQVDEHTYREHQNVHDKLYDSRSGLGFYYRYGPRDIAAISRAAGIDRPRIHASVLERIGLRTEGYAPGSIPPGSVVVNNGGDELRRAKLQATLDTVLARGMPLDTVRRLVTVRKVGHVTALTCSIALGLSLLADGLASEGLLGTAASAVSLSGLATLAWKTLQHYPIPLAVLIAGAVGGWLSSWKARRGMEDAFADSWRTALSDLRAAAS